MTARADVNVPFGACPAARRQPLAWLLFLTVLVNGCISTRPAGPAAPTPETPGRGVASWYGEEFAGRTTANGEIFDPTLLTAAHRTLPFGTVLDVKNLKTGKTVRVRVNDRGPFVGNRVLDLSYAAAKQIDLIEPGTGEIEMNVVRMGRGEREPPQPYVIAVNEPPGGTKPPRVVKENEAGPPEIAFPIPGEQPKPAVEEPVTVETIEVHEERNGNEVRQQVAPDGRTVETVEVKPTGETTPAPAAENPGAPGHSSAERIDRTNREAAKPVPAPDRKKGFTVQVGAFSVEENARLLQAKLEKIGEKSHVDHEDLYRVRIGPFETRDQAIAVRTRLESNGISAIVIAE